MGCGKSRVLKILLEAGGIRAVGFSADQEVSRLLDTQSVQDELIQLFGPESVKLEAGERRMDRAWLRRHVFADNARRLALEELLHPAVFSAFESGRAAAEAAGRNLFLAEVPLHYESQSTLSADLVVVVASSRPVQVRRLMESRGLDETIIEKMLSAQWSIEAKVERADVVIWNDGSMEALEAQALTLARQLSQE